MVKPLPLSDCPLRAVHRIRYETNDYCLGLEKWATGNAYSIQLMEGRLPGWIHASHALYLILVGHWIMYYLLMRGVSLD